MGPHPAVPAATGTMRDIAGEAGMGGLYTCIPYDVIC